MRTSQKATYLGLMLWFLGNLVTLAGFQPGFHAIPVNDPVLVRIRGLGVCYYIEDVGLCGPESFPCSHWLCNKYTDPEGEPLYVCATFAQDLWSDDPLYNIINTNNGLAGRESYTSSGNHWCYNRTLCDPADNHCIPHGDMLYYCVTSGNPFLFSEFWDDTLTGRACPIGNDS